MKKKTKKKVRIKGLLVLLLIVYLIGMFLYYLFTVSYSTIVVKGNDLISEKEVISLAKIKDNTSIFKILFANTCNGIEKSDYVKKCKINVSLDRKITFNIEENKILFYDSLNKKYLLSSGKQIDDLGFIGYPILINYTPSDVLDNFVKGLSKIDTNIINMISEIEYNPDRYNDTIIDEDRFLLRMNDGNEVYVNSVNIKKLNNYQSIFASVDDKGILYLDSSSKTYIFKKYGDVNES